MPETKASARSSAARIKTLEAKRKSLYASVLKLSELSTDLWRPEDKRSFILQSQTFEDTRSEYARVVDELVAAKLDSDPDYSPSYEVMEIFNELICQILLAKTELTKNTIVETITAEKRTPRPRLPPMELLKFSGDATKWPAFAEVFKRVVGSNPDLAESEKVHYLISHLSGAALSTINGILSTGENYSLIWNRLESKYEDVRILASTYLGKLLKFKALTSHDTKSLNKFSDEFESTVVALRALHLPDLADFIITHFALSKLDVSTVRNFEQSLDYEIPSFDTLSKFIAKHNKILSRTDAMHLHSTIDVSAKSPKAHVLITLPSESWKRCGYCSETTHKIHACDKFRALSAAERLAAARKRNLCTNCLYKHSSEKCPSKKRCGICDKTHNTLLHLPRPAIVNSPETVDKRIDKAVVLTVASGRERDDSDAVRDNAVSVSPTALVLLHDAGRRTATKARILIDTGAAGNFVSLECCKRNRLRINYQPTTVYGLGDAPQAVIGYAHFTITSRFDSRCSYRIRAAVVNKLTDHMPALHINDEIRNSLNDIPLADNLFYEQEAIHCILGAAVIPKILTGRPIKVASSNLYALESTLGYIVIGELRSIKHPRVTSCFFSSSPEDELNSRVQAFWNLETVENKRHLSQDEKACEEDFEQNVSRLADGSFVVSLPFKEEASALGNSRNTAECRLRSLEKRLDSNPEMRAGYNATFRDYLERGFLREVKETAESPSAYYIPHRAVYRPDKDTSKIRLVLDASCKSSSGKSLNDILHNGPNIQSRIFNLLINFRLFEVAHSADIEKMYFSVKVHPDHRRFLRVLYRFAGGEPVGTYEFSSLPMGLSSSSYLSVKVLRRIFSEEDSPSLRRLLESSTCTYMDDYLLSVPTPEEATSIRVRLTETHARAGFKLTKWLSNSTQFMNEAADSARGASQVNIDSEAHVKLVGLWWDVLADAFVFKAQEADLTVTCTKRHMLSVTASLYDPLGFLAPVTAGFKSLVQECWKRELAWDQPAPADITAAWRNLRAEMPALENLRIPRHLGLATGTELTLLGFSDASERCLGAVIYARVGALDDPADSVRFLCAKSRITPLKRITLARLELCAALLLANLLQSVIAEIRTRHPVSQFLAFSDSTVALAWIRSSPHRWQTFVANRTAAIQEIVPASAWFHIPGSENPSDIITRPPSPSRLAATEQWVGGPPWAYLPSSAWPNACRAEREHPDDVPEAKALALAVNLPADIHPLDSAITNASSLNKLVNVVVLVLRFGKKLRSRGSITPSDREAAEDVLLKHIQATHFPSELRALSEGRVVSKKLRKLTPIMINGLLCVGGRLKHAELTLSQKHPILLPPESRFSELVIRDLHVRNFHTGPELLSSLLRDKYWILSARRLVRKMVHACNTCFRHRPVPNNPLMGNLPASRFQEGKSFVNSGVDYAGQLLVRMNRGRGSKTTKAYICLFVCLATKAVHLELVSDLSTNLFIAAFKRFIARRGPVTCILSDGGRNFIGARRKLSEIFALVASEEYNREIIRELTPSNIEFKINPPLAPHFGGIWEANIKCVKTHLFRVLGNQILTYEELNTLLIQIESVLNSRPLCALSQDPNEPSALTPAHFLTVQPLKHIPAPDLRASTLERLPRHALVDRMVQSYWDRWRMEYLNSLQAKEKWNIPGHPLQVGKVVLLNEPNAPTLCWPLGIIEQTFPGSDGVTRVVKVRTKSGSYVRPATRICVLPTQ